MPFFNVVPWKTFTQVIPLLADIIFKVKNNAAAEHEQQEINELKKALKVLDGEVNSLFKGMKILIVATAALFVVSLAALIVALVALYG